MHQNNNNTKYRQINKKSKTHNENSYNKNTENSYNTRYNHIKTTQAQTFAEM